MRFWLSKCRGSTDTCNQYFNGGISINHINEKCGCYTIIENTNKRNKYGKLIYAAQCVCGTVRYDVLSNFKLKKTDRCPHFVIYEGIKYPIGSIKNKDISHIFRGVLQRCYNPNNKNYKYYGAKNIKVCESWVENPSLFEAWSYDNGYSKGLSIDRIHEDIGYTPENCRWVDEHTNARFKSNTNYITATVTLSGKQWASLIPSIGINYINKLYKKCGEKATVDFIESKLKDKHKI